MRERRKDPAFRDAEARASRAYYERTRDARVEYAKAYRARNLEERRAYDRERHARTYTLKKRRKDPAP